MSSPTTIGRIRAPRRTFMFCALTQPVSRLIVGIDSIPQGEQNKQA
jgi:hypothetical protein